MISRAELVATIGCGCNCHRIPGIKHIRACCDTPPARSEHGQLLTRLWQIEVARLLGARNTRTAERHTTELCTVCDEAVLVIEDEVPRGGSAGEVWWWVPRRAEAHTRECFKTSQDRADALHAELKAKGKAVDPWGDE